MYRSHAKAKQHRLSNITSQRRPYPHIRFCLATMPGWFGNMCLKDSHSITRTALLTRSWGSGSVQSSISRTHICPESNENCLHRCLAMGSVLCQTSLDSIALCPSRSMSQGVSSCEHQQCFKTPISRSHISVRRGSCEVTP